MAAKINTTMKPAEWALLILLSLAWGGSFFFNAVAVAVLPPFTVVFARVFLAALILLALLPVLGIAMPRGLVVWRAFLVMGLINNAVPFTLIVWGQIHIASGLAAILNATTPLFTVLVAHVVTADERLTKGRIIGAMLGFFGVVALIGLDGLTASDARSLAILAVLGGALAYAFAGIYGRRFAEMGVPPLATAAGQVTASSALLLPVMLVLEQPWQLPMPGVPVLLSLLGIASISTAFAYFLYFRILATAGATNLLLVTFLIPVSAILLGVLFLGEVLLPQHLVGMALIGGGLAAIDGRIGRWVRPRTPKTRL